MTNQLDMFEQLEVADRMAAEQKKKGGIQAGTTAASVESTKLDNQLKDIAKKLGTELVGYTAGHRKHDPLFENIGSGCMPDGGLWFDTEGKVKAAFEAKHQGNHGNAQERHAKNYLIAKKHRGESFKYITFMTGEGAQESGVLDIYAKTMLHCENDVSHQSVNVTNPNGLSFYLKVEGFTNEEIESIMRAALI